MEQGQIIIIFIIFNYLMIKYRNSNNIKLVALVGNYLLLSIALSAYFGISDIITPINSVLVSILAILGIYNLYRKNKHGLLSPIEKKNALCNLLFYNIDFNIICHRRFNIVIWRVFDLSDNISH